MKVRSFDLKVRNFDLKSKRSGALNWSQKDQELWLEVKKIRSFDLKVLIFLIAIAFAMQSVKVFNWLSINDIFGTLFSYLRWGFPISPRYSKFRVVSMTREKKRSWQKKRNSIFRRDFCFLFLLVFVFLAQLQSKLEIRLYFATRSGGNKEKSEKCFFSVNLKILRFFFGEF